MRQAVLCASVLGGIVTVTYLLKPIRLLHVDGFCSSVYWTARSWLWNSPVSTDFGVWRGGDPSIPGQYNKDRARLIRMWEFLRPHFVSRGYHLYARENPADLFSMLFPTSALFPTEKQEKSLLPFAKCYYKKDADAEYCFYVSR